MLALLVKTRVLSHCSGRLFMSKICGGDTDIHIPRSRLTVNFARSSGAGGQNVNKVNTKAELRFNVDTAEWLDDHVKMRLKSLNPHSVTKEGDFVLTSQRHRTQSANLEDAFDKLAVILAEAAVIPKVRALKTAPSDNAKTEWMQEKRRRSEVKARRSGRGDWDD